MPVTVKRIALCAGALLLVPSFAAASDLDAKGDLQFAPDAIKSWSFESADDLLKGSVYSIRTDSSGYGFKVSKLTDAAQINLTSAEDALAGQHALRIGGATPASSSGFAIADEALFKTLAGLRVEITMWARADGATPSFAVTYAKSEWAIESSLDFALSPSTRTGRETSDGWVEYTTGPIDGSVWGVPIRAIAFFPPRGNTFLVDALEIRKASGALTPNVTCTQADVDKTCGEDADCLYGHCVPSSVTWGAMPNGGHRAEFAARWSHLGSRLIGDRQASEFGLKTFTPTARELAQYARSSRKFFGGINRLVNGLRDNHTSMGSPTTANSNFGPTLQYGWSGALHACFGVVEKDLTGGGLGFGVFHAGDAPVTGVVLKPGDMLTAIDGIDPKKWADEVIPGINRTSPNDPKSDWAAYAEVLSAAISVRAKEITITRCASATACTGDKKTELKIDVASKVFARLSDKGGWGEDIKYFGCSPRFRDSVADYDPRPTTGYEDVVTPRTVDGIVNVSFDGFTGEDEWPSKMTGIFEPKPAMVLMDTRQGNGGSSTNVTHLFNLLRGRDEQFGFITVVNGTYDEASPATLFKTYEKCVGEYGGGGIFGCAGAWGMFSDLEAPAGAKSKIAWLNTLDVSANDFLPRLIKGRTALKIFAPHPTSGAFGAVTSFSSFAPGWSGGSIQYQDSRFASKYDDFAGARWESGHGVEPDVVIAQKVSDAIAGKDTMLDAARAWLKAE
jgi:hypothetical protein